MRRFLPGVAGLMLVISLLSGLWLARHPAPRAAADLTFWIFAPEHEESYRKALAEFETRHRVKVDLRLVSQGAVSSRLQAALWSDLEVPDLVEIPIDFAPGFFRGPLHSIGLLDLTERLRESGLLRAMVASRFAPYTSRGRIFGLPHDVHPVGLAYREDLVRAAGIDVQDLDTWDNFVAAGRRLTVPNRRYMLELFDTRSAHYDTLLFQRGGRYFDPSGEVRMDDPIAMETMLWMVRQVAGPHKIAGNLGPGQILTQAIEEGYFLFVICPDWRSRTLQLTVPKMAGKMRLIPLPAVLPGGRRTSTWGGTMLSITRSSPRPELTWQLAQHLYLNTRDLGARFADTNIVPALRTSWSDPAFSAPREYWGGQRIGLLYTGLAPAVPPQYGSPFLLTAKAKMGDAVVACAARYNERGEEGIEEFVRGRLQQAADEVRAMQMRNPYH